MTDTPTLDIKPFFVSFFDLCMALQTLHVWDRGAISDLHDVWLKGAPSPDSQVIIKNYDPRLRQEGAREKRLILPTRLAAWIVMQSERRGMPLTMKQAANIVTGQPDYGLDQG